MAFDFGDRNIDLAFEVAGFGNFNAVALVQSSFDMAFDDKGVAGRNFAGRQIFRPTSSRRPSPGPPGRRSGRAGPGILITRFMKSLLNGEEALSSAMSAPGEEF